MSENCKLGARADILSGQQQAPSDSGEHTQIKMSALMEHDKVLLLYIAYYLEWSIKKGYKAIHFKNTIGK
jgi:hypothetical protein